MAAVAQATLSGKVQGTVQEVRVREGALVSKGQALVVMDSRDLQANLARAQAEVENAKSHLVRMKRLYTEESVAKPGVIERGQLTGVFVVGPDSIAHLRWVKVGRTMGASVEILSGLNGGERILADASQGADGARVEITEAVAPTP